MQERRKSNEESRDMVCRHNSVLYMKYILCEIHSLLNYGVFIPGIKLYSVQDLWGLITQDIFSDQKPKVGMIIKENVSF